jgi:DNA-binding XRE family transcriptional regulator
MRTRRTIQSIRNEIGKRYFETEISQKELAKEYNLSTKTIGIITNEYKVKMGITSGRMDIIKKILDEVMKNGAR